jgi:hypothetical protein
MGIKEWLSTAIFGVGCGLGIGWGLGGVCKNPHLFIYNIEFLCDFSLKLVFFTT